MKTSLIKIFSLIVLGASFNATILAQVSAEFTANKVEGCAPLVIDFKITNSTGISKYEWVAGDGQTNITTATPSFTYNSPGAYTVVLTVNKGLSTETTVTKTGFINVYDQPEASFTISEDTICAPFVVKFNDQSTSVGYAVTQWSWDFKNGSTLSNSANPAPTKNYLNTGVYNTSLIVENPTLENCIDTVYQTLVVISDPVADFSVSPISACAPPLDVTFANASTAGFEYLWSFDNGNTTSTSSLNNLVQTYTAYGTYTPSLTVTGYGGSCVEVKNKTGAIKILEVIADIAASTTVSCPGTSNKIFFNASGSQNGNSYAWNFGDGATGTGVSTNHAYTTANTYTVNVTVTNSATGCTAIKSQQIFIEEVTVDFSVAQDYFCENPGTAVFSDLSYTNGNSITSWNWDFGDGGISTSQNPSHNFVSEGTYTVILTVTSDNACKSKIVKTNYITVSYPKAKIALISPRKGCEALDVTLTDGSINDSGGNIVDWQWDFGDGNNTTVSSSGLAVQNTFLVDSFYVVSLTVTNNLGCTDVVTDSVLVGSKPIADFMVTLTPSCARDKVEFYDSSKFVNVALSVDSLDEWIWSGSGGFGSQDQNPTHQYDQVSALENGGLNSVTLTVGYNGCYDTIVFLDTVQIYGPIIQGINIIDAVDCANPYNRKFTMIAGDTTSYIWVIQDSLMTFSDTIQYGYPATLNPNSTLNGTILGTDLDTLYYQFPTGISDDYFVSVLAWNNLTEPFDTIGDSCAYIKTIVVPIRDVRAGFSHNDSICKNATIYFNGVNVTANTDQSLDAIKWRWNFGDGVESTLGSGVISSTRTTGTYDFPVHQYISPGKFRVKLIVENLYGCLDTILDSVYVFKPVANFTSDTLYGCSPLNVTFTDVSTSEIPISDYIWDFAIGSGVASTSTVNYTFSALGSHTTFLTITDELGCQDVASLTVEVIKPTAKFTANDFTLCEGTPVSFTNQSTAYSALYPLKSYGWEFGDNKSAAAANPQHTYQAAGNYNVTLTVTDTLGCTNSFDLDNFDVQGLPVIDIISNDTLFECYPAKFWLVDNSTGNNIVSRYLDLNSGIPQTEPYPFDTVSTNYFDPGFYDIFVELETSYGCKTDSLFRNYVHVDGPYAEFSVSEDSVCLNQLIDFKIDTLNYLVDHWSWTFGDGVKYLDTLGNGGVDTTYAYTNLPTTGGNYFNAKLVLYDVNEECNPDTSVTIFVFAVGADFLMNGLPDDTLLSCPPFEVNVIDQSSGANSWNWEFEGGETYDVLSPPLKTYTNIDADTIATYTITLNITESGGAMCTDSKVKYVRIYPKPPLQISNDTTICVGNSIQLQAIPDSLDILYSWMPSLSLSFDTIPNPIATPHINTTYSLLIENEYSCQNNDSVAITVVPIPAFTVTPNDTTIIIGDSAKIVVTLFDSGFVAVWAPKMNLTCYDCLETTFFGLVNSDYIVTIADSGRLCPVNTENVRITVKEACAADVADALTPAEETNNMIYIRGWGIEEVIVFEIYNRWGERVYENPGDLYHGWDGTFNGKPQAMDTYVLVARVKFFCDIPDKEIRKQISLFR